MSGREELKPCPFCGGAAEIIEADEAGDSAYAVQCQTRGCEASSRVAFAIKEPVDGILAEAWNRRAPPAGREELIGRLNAIRQAADYTGLGNTHAVVSLDLLEEIAEALSRGIGDQEVDEGSSSATEQAAPASGLRPSNAGLAGQVTPEFIEASARAAIKALRGLEQTAIMLETWAPECFPLLPEHEGKKHFARVMMESAAEEIRQAWADAIKEVETVP